MAIVLKDGRRIEMHLVGECVCGQPIYATSEDADKPAIAHATPQCRDFAQRDGTNYWLWLKLERLRRAVPLAEA